jgi:hypothetical protein
VRREGEDTVNRQTDRRQHGFDRRTLVKVAGGAALAMILPAGRAEAGRQWCQVDPAFRFADAADPDRAVTAHVDVLADPDVPGDTTGPIELAVAVPSGIDAELLAQDDGFGNGYAISVIEAPDARRARRRLPLVVAARVPAAGRHRVRLAFAPDGVVEDADSADGWTNDWVVVRANLSFPDA